MTHTHTTRRRRGSTADRVERPRAPYIDRKLGTFSVLSDEGLEIIEANADTILHDTGMDFVGDGEILEIFRNTGCDVSGQRVRFERGLHSLFVVHTGPVDDVRIAGLAPNATVCVAQVAVGQV